MKNYLYIIFIITCTCTAYSQENKGIPKDYEVVLLDGKKAYMNKITGAIISILPSDVKKSSSVNEKFIEKGNHHVVKVGETIYGIAKKYGITVDDIYMANKYLTQNSTIRIGQILYLDKTSEDGAVENRNTFHIVQSGDNLFRISRKYRVSIEELKRKNNLTSTNITVGQKLKL